MDAEILQGSHEWRQLRAGLITASNVDSVMATVKSGEAATRAKYRIRLAFERISGLVDEDTFDSEYMRWGREKEPEAREEYEIATCQYVREVAFIKHPRLRAGASPDGLVGQDGGVEIKCPSSPVHFEYIETERIPSSYRRQILMNLACSERKWWDFVTYDPRIPDLSLRLFIIRVNRSEVEKEIEEMEKAVEAFDADVEATVARIKAHGEAARLLWNRPGVDF
jgi:putative phage-type endonuclease